MKIPGPDHPITLAPAAKRWRARFAGHVIADSANALVLQEASYPPVIYFPREDVEIGYLSRTARGTHCPYKGDASYFTLHMDGQFAENSVWTYETPFPAMEQIAGPCSAPNSAAKLPASRFSRNVMSFCRYTSTARVAWRITREKPKAVNSASSSAGRQPSSPSATARSVAWPKLRRSPT